MKATIDRQELLAALGRALAVAREHALHAKSVELRALRSCLTIIGTDLDTWVICDLRSEGEAGRVVVDGSRIAAFAAAADTEEIELSSTKAGLRVSAGRAAIDGTYPDWERVVPTDGGTECAVPSDRSRYCPIQSSRARSTFSCRYDPHSQEVTVIISQENDIFAWAANSFVRYEAVLPNDVPAGSLRARPPRL